MRGRTATPEIMNLEEALPMAAAILLKKKSASKIARQYYNDPVGFIDRFIEWKDGEGPTAYQEKILEALRDHGRVAAYGPHGLGKTTVEAWCLIWFAVTRDAMGQDWKNPTLASAWRQLTKFLWPEVRKWAKRLKWKELGWTRPWDDYELQTLALKLQHGESFALASDQPTSLEGAHAESLLYTFDESKAIPAETWDSVEGAFSSAGSDTTSAAFALACSTPGEESGRFYEICSRKAGLEDWHVIHVSLEETIAAGRVSREWASARRRQWGDTSVVYRNRVLGQFASSDTTGVIPLSWVEIAQQRWDEELASQMKIQILGVDVGGGGDNGDLTTFASRTGNWITKILRFPRGDTMETTGRVVQEINHGSLVLARPVVDAIGVGAGVVSRLRELDVEVVPFIASGSASDKSDISGELRFQNMRSWAWWHLRELLDPTNGHDLALPPDDMLVGDLTAPRWRVLSGGLIQVEAKDDIRKRIGRSTDTGDAVIQAFSVFTDPTQIEAGGSGLRPARELYEDYTQGTNQFAGLLDRQF